MSLKKTGFCLMAVRTFPRNTTGKVIFGLETNTSILPDLMYTFLVPKFKNLLKFSSF
jgi:hypothetical protein